MSAATSNEPAGTVVVTGDASGLEQRVRVGRHELRADEPASAGGTAPLHPFIVTLGLPMSWVHYGNPDQNGHSPNENLRLDCFYRGIKTSAAVFSEMAKI